jgi:hypothetical protein
MKEVKKMQKLVSILWACLLVWLFSALIHSTDSGIGGVTGLATLSNLASVSAVAAGLFLPPILVCQFTYIHRGWRGLAIAVLICGVVLGAIVGLGGSSAKSAAGLSVSIAGATALIIAVLILGSAPLIIIPKLRPHGRTITE